MSTISTLIAQARAFVTTLRSSIWAIDVRDGIGDSIQKLSEAIEQCYSDVSNPTLQTEALEAALQNKIDEGEMAALTIGDHTITTAKLAQGVIDNTLATSGAAADAKKTGDELTAIKADLGDLSDLETESKKDLVSAINEAAQSGLSDEIKEVLLECIAHVYWDDNLGETHYTNLENALYGVPTEIWSWSTEYSGAGRLKKGGVVYDKSVNGERKGFIYDIMDNRFGIYTDKGKQCANGSDDNPVPDVFPIPIPSTATKVTITVTPATDYLFGYIGKYVRGSGGGTGYDYNIINESPSWTHKGTYECTFEAQKDLFLGYNGKKEDGSNYTSAERNNRVVTVTFE